MRIIQAAQSGLTDGISVTLGVVRGAGGDMGGWESVLGEC